MEQLESDVEGEMNQISLYPCLVVVGGGEKCPDDNVLCTIMVVHLDDQCKS